MNYLVLGAGLLVVLGAATGQGGDPKEYAANLAKWRKAQTDELTADEGFLSVAGLFWLKEGDSTVGSDPSSVVRLSQDSSPAKVGTLHRIGNLVSFTPEAGVDVKFRGGDAAALKSDATRVDIGKITFMVITRGARVGIRVFDKSCKGYREFKGQTWFPPSPKYVVQAEYHPYNPPKLVGITNVLGDVTNVPIVAYLTFMLDGKPCRLDAQGSGEGFFINFRDLTSGKATYPAGRFLDAPMPVNGYVTLDFNKATNPPCAFTTFATCPLPPKQNYLSVSIPAGEKTHHPVGE